MTEQIIENSKVLCAAVKNGSLKIVEDLLKDGADVNMIDDTYIVGNVTLLHSAVCERQVKMVELLIKYGCDVNVKDGWSKSPLETATENWDFEMADLLLFNGAKRRKDPNALCTAVMKRDLKIIEDLLKDGADVNSTDESNLIGAETLLHSTVRQRCQKMAKLLIEYGANVNAKNTWGRTPIADAIRIGDTEMVELLLTNGADLKGDPNILYDGVENGYLNIVEELLKGGADVNTVDNTSCITGVTLLHNAVLCQQLEMAKLLIKYGADTNTKDSRGTTPIVTATYNWDTEMTKLLLINGAGRKEDPKVLSSAVMLTSLNTVKELLEEKAEIKMSDNTNLTFGRTLLHSTVAWSQMEKAELLIKYGANVNAKNDEGNTPIDDAIQNEDVDMVRLLLNSGADIKEDLMELCYMSGPTSGLLQYHIAKMKAAGLYVSERNLLWISNDRDIDYFLTKCEAEIEIMKSKKIGNSCASFYDILKKNTNGLAKNESIVQALKSDDYKKRFPIYANMIDSRFRRGVTRKELLEQVRNKLSPSLFKSLNELPILCTEKIYSYLSDMDLRILLIGCELFNKDISI